MEKFLVFFVVVEDVCGVGVYVVGKYGFGFWFYWLGMFDFWFLWLEKFVVFGVVFVVIVCLFVGCEGVGGYWFGKRIDNGSKSSIKDGKFF